jgi:TetR/AcrR family transcriptional repressor of bet genes
MGRPSERQRRREELTAAFARALAERGAGGATVAAVAALAGVSPGLVHHHFRDKADLYESLLRSLSDSFRRRSAGGVSAWIEGALGLGPGADNVEARAWVGLLAEAIPGRPSGEPSLLVRLRRRVDAEHQHLRHQGLDDDVAAALLALTTGALVLGAVGVALPPGYAARAARRFVDAVASHDGPVTIS